MNTFLLHLQSATQYERIENVVSFVGEDDSGSFGILSGHGRMMTLLGFGLARFRVIDQDWEFLALPGALAYFVDDQLYLNTRRYLRGKDYERLSVLLRKELLAEEEALREMKQSIRRLEEEMFKRLWKMKQSGEWSG
jgi:F-type H+-transporting ATPase subunit epsilon